MQIKKNLAKNLILTDKENNKYFSNEAVLDFSNKKLQLKILKFILPKSGDLGEHARLKGNSMISNEDSTIIKKGIFTTCKQNDKCPPWSIQSKEIEHDKKNKLIKYGKAWLNFYDVPVFIFQKFSPRSNC